MSDELIARIRACAQTKYDWDSYDGLPTRPQAVEDAIKFVRLVDCKVVDVGPTNDGSIEFEWARDGIDMILTFEGKLDTKSGNSIWGIVKGSIDDD